MLLHVCLLQFPLNPTDGVTLNRLIQNHQGLKDWPNLSSEEVDELFLQAGPLSFFVIISEH